MMPVKTEIFDAIVVGSGAAGGWAAKELTEGGLSVLLLEAGRHLDIDAIAREAYLAENGPCHSLYQRRLDRVYASVRGQHIQARCGAFNRLNKEYFVSDSDLPYTTPKGKPFYWFRGRQVGGRLHTWTRLTPRMSDYEFQAARSDGYDADWPLCYADLAPYYDKVEAFLGVLGTEEHIPQLPDGIFVDRPELTPMEEAFADLLPSKFPGLRAIPARRVVDDPQGKVSTIRAAANTGRLTLRSHAVVQQVVVKKESGQASGVVYVDMISGKHEHARAGMVVLCASSIESVRILMNSACQQHPTGIGNSTGILGRYFMDHLMMSSRGTVRAQWLGRYPIVSRTFSVGLFIPAFRNISAPEPRFVRSYGMYWGIGANEPTWSSQALGEMLPQFENHVTLDRSRRDRYGVPIARIECAHGSNDNAMIADMLSTQHEIAEALDLKVAEVKRGIFALLANKKRTRTGAFIPGASIHELGGARMGLDPSTSVLNAHNQCWDVPNVYVTDGSCFVTAGYQNPTLTIMAITTRACDHIIQSFGV